MSVVSFRTSRQMVFFAGDVAQNDLLKLAEAVAAPLSRGLSAAVASAPDPESVQARMCTRSISGSWAAQRSGFMLGKGDR